jgi:hypothetical protein
MSQQQARELIKRAQQQESVTHCELIKNFKGYQTIRSRKVLNIANFGEIHHFDYKIRHYGFFGGVHI